AQTGDERRKVKDEVKRREGKRESSTQRDLLRSAMAGRCRDVKNSARLPIRNAPIKLLDVEKVWQKTRRFPPSKLCTPRSSLLTLLKDCGCLHRYMLCLGSTKFNCPRSH